MPVRILLLAAATVLVCVSTAAAEQDAPAHRQESRVSYYRDIRPIFQAHCQGCHQPAKPSGSYVMTSFDRLLAGGETEAVAVVPGDPEESNLMMAITPVDGEAEMPKGKKPLAESEIELIGRWIAEGAADDTPVSAKQRYDMDQPPVYTRPPVITSIDFSPDGRLLAVAGFHEVLLVDPETGALVARLVGMAERIESVAFSPDGARLLVTGGLPGRMGEVQVWNVTERELLLSAPVTYDTVYGGSWSPDGKKIAFGCADNTLRAIDAESGQQVLFQGAHEDWIRDTVFSVDGSHLISASRDMTAKLTEVTTQRFVDNITSITPGALKGGMQAVARHPERDEIVVGGSDGVAKVYRVHRLTNRVIGDDGNLIRRMPPMQGRIFGVDVSRDGKRLAAVSSLDGAGSLHIYSYEFDTSLPDNIKAINEKVVTGRSKEEHEALEKYHTDGVELLAQMAVPSTGLYTVAFHPSGRLVATAGGDGVVRLIDAGSGEIVRQFAPAPLSAPTKDDEGRPAGFSLAASQAEEFAPESLPADAELVALEVEPAQVELNGPFDYVQLLVTGQLASGEKIDVTRAVRGQLASEIATLSPTGVVRPLGEGQGTLELSLAGHSTSIPVVARGLHSNEPSSFIRDVNPILSKLGCNAGTCHGAAKGRNGFKLSLRGYDPLFDVRALNDDLASRRVNLASPDDSLMLLKPTGAVPHEGGQLIEPQSSYYAVLRKWIAEGAALELATPRITKIEVAPIDPTVNSPGAKQQIRVLATYADGRVRDVTREAFIESGNTEVATADRNGLMTAVRRGEAPILARYEGAYAATTLTVMGDRSGFVWEQPPTWGRVDELVAQKWERMKIRPSELCTDTEFLRRAYLDLTGLPPTADEVRSFVADERDTKVKRDELIDRLIGSQDFVEFWTNKWADLLQVNRKFLGAEGAAEFRGWIRDEVARNTPYDQFARKILTASGSNRENPAASYYKILRQPVDIMENTTHLFLAVRFNCNKCHDHPFERWTQDQYFQTAAYFAQVGLKQDPESGDRKIGGTAVEGAKPLYEIVYDQSEGEVIHERTSEPADPVFPFEAEHEADKSATRREQLAAWVVSPENPYFARSYVNRLWGYLLGVGIIEPIDDIRAGNPPSNPELLEYLTDEFIESGFDVQHVMRLICKSRTYQLSVATNDWNADDRINYSHAMARRLPAEVLLDTVYRVTGSVSKFPGVQEGTRAAALPDSGVELPSGFLDKFGRPARESACECERSTDLQLGPVMALISGPTIEEAIAGPNNGIAQLVAEKPNDRELIDEMFLRFLGRPAREQELEASLNLMRGLDEHHEQLVARLEQREAESVALRPQLEAEREQAIADARQELTTFEQELAPKLAELEQQKAEKTARLEAELKEYESTLPAKLAEWEAQRANATKWVAPRVVSAHASTGAKLCEQPDGSIIAEAKDGPATYTVTVETELTKLTGIRLEALADDSLPSRGPGLAGNGNFVLTEFEVLAAAKSNSAAQQQLALENAKADYSQGGYDIATAVDGQRPGSNNGWAVDGQTGRDHQAVFELKESLEFAEPAILTFKLDQQFGDKKHLLGKFRITLADSAKPIELGPPGNISAILRLAQADRSDEQQDKLLAYFREQDKEWQKRHQAWEESKQPLPVDPHLVELRAKLERASAPVPEDAELMRLRHDVEVSRRQLDNRRLTAAQDLAWALINSPEFLFNH